MTDDELLVLEYIHGRLRKKQGAVIVEYFSLGSEEEKKAKEILAELLRDHNG